MTTLKVAFAGTPDFAVPCLKALIDMPQVDVVAVYTQPDRPVGRGRKLEPTPVKQAAQNAGIEVYQPEKVNNAKAREKLASLHIDIMVVVAYGMLLTQKWLETPRLGCINVHASLLPRWRGAAPIQRAIESGDEYTGVSLMQMHKRLDAGPVYVMRQIAIAPDDTAQTLHDKLSQLGATALKESLLEIASGAIDAKAQDESQVTYAEKLHKSEAPIDWQQNARDIVHRIHAFNPWPVATCRYREIDLRILKARYIEAQSEQKPGTIIRADNVLHVQSASGVVVIDELQKPGAKAMPVKAFLAGMPLCVGEVFA